MPFIDPRLIIAADRERHSAFAQLAMHLTPRCDCSCHSGLGHCDSCCQHRLCRDCLAYGMG